MFLSLLRSWRQTQEGPEVLGIEEKTEALGREEEREREVQSISRLVEQNGAHM